MDRVVSIEDVLKRMRDHLHSEPWHDDNPWPYVEAVSK